MIDHIKRLYKINTEIQMLLSAIELGTASRVGVNLIDIETLYCEASETLNSLKDEVFGFKERTVQP